MTSFKTVRWLVTRESRKRKTFYKCWASPWYCKVMPRLVIILFIFVCYFRIAKALYLYDSAGGAADSARMFQLYSQSYKVWFLSNYSLTVSLYCLMIHIFFIYLAISRSFRSELRILPNCLLTVYKSNFFCYFGCGWPHSGISELLTDLDLKWNAK